MFHKGLWYYHVKQSKYILLGFWLVAIFSGFLLYNHAGNVEQNILYFQKHHTNDPYHYYFNTDFQIVSLLQLLLCAGLATYLIGSARSNQSLDYMYSLPVKRENLFLSKFFIGLVHIVGSTTLSLMIHLVILETSVLKDFIPVHIFWVYYVHQLLILIGIYAFSLWLGLIAGNMISHLALCAILPFIPYGLYSLLNELVSLHAFAFGNMDLREWWFFRDATEAFFLNISFPIKLMDIQQLFHQEQYIRQDLPSDLIQNIRSIYYSLTSFAVPVITTLASLWGIVRMSKGSLNEYNGNVLLSSKLRPFLTAGVMVCAFLFGGMIIEGMLGNHFYSYDEFGNELINETKKYQMNLIIFYISAIISAMLGYFILRITMRLKLHTRKG
ncbi:ABC transporter permease [Paenibacillus turpanensis]|uniref:ABC transporter permease n=1 Tax=Paenibacillus turpanensis TaxID=2689078 RepID=UPI001407564C|nr:ABC transporter permease [Paenibacillus turpanensis]